MKLEVELRKYSESLPGLLADEGKFVLIKGNDIVGLYETYADAIQAGYEKFRLEPFLVKHIESTDQLQFITRFVEPCPI